MIGGGGFAGFGDDLLGCGDRFLRFLLLHTGGGGAGFFDQLVRLGIGLSQEFPGVAASVRASSALILSALARPSAMR